MEIDVTDSSPFFIRPFHTKEEDKAILDKEMKRLCYLGILKEGFSAYSRPVMLISRKVTQDKRLVTDFSHLNMRIAKNNLTYPLLKDMFMLLGGSKCEVSVLDLEDAFHSLRLTENSKKYCGILPYFCSASYLYQRMPMGLNISPAVWQSYINAILSCLSNKKYCEAIMDDLLLFTSNKQTHSEKLVDLLQALCKNGLKISPKKCQLFKTDLQYMGNTIFIKEKRVCVKSLRSRLEAIQKLKPSMNQKGCRSLAGVVNFVSIFCLELQKLLKPIYELTKKGRPFVWGDEQQKAFDEIKSRLLKLPVFSMPDKRGRCLLYSDTSKYATRSALYQVQDGKPKLIAYLSKRMLEAARNYSTTELEMCGLAINIASFAHLLKRVDFDAVVDHLAIIHIMQSKMEPATNRIKRLLCHKFSNAKGYPQDCKNTNQNKEKDSKTLPTRVDQQPPRGIVIPLGALIPPVVMQPNVRPPPKSPNIDNATTSPSLGPEPNIEFEENSPHQEGIITEMYVAPDQSYLEEPQELIKLVSTSKVVQKYLLQQADIDKILEIIKRKVLKGTHLPLTIEEIQAGYLTSSFFKDLYRYLAQNIMPHKVEALAESFILLDSLLFKLVMVPDKKRHFWQFQRPVQTKSLNFIIPVYSQDIKE